MRALFNCKMLKVVEKTFPDFDYEEDSDGQIIIKTGTYITGDENYYRNKRKAA